MASETVKVDAEDLYGAYQIADQGYPGMEGYVSSKTGKVYITGPEGTIDEDPENPNPPDLETSDEYLLVPSKGKLGLGREIVFDFAEEFMPADYEEVRDIFRRSGAYRRIRPRPPAGSPKK